MRIILQALRRFLRPTDPLVLDFVRLRVENQRLRAALEKHHYWHLEIGTVTFRKPDPKGDGLTVIEYELDLSAEYCDSSLCEQTLKALHPAAHTAGEQKGK